MTRRKIIGLVVTTTLIGVCGGVTTTPQFKSMYQLWYWMQRYASVTEARERLRANPNDAKAHQTLAWTLLSSETRGKEVSVKEARHEWEEALRCDPSNEAVVTIAVPLLYMDKGSTAQQHAEARRLLIPIAEHGGPKTQPEAIKMLRDLDEDEHVE